jgi:hypothetical protein
LSWRRNITDKPAAFTTAPKRLLYASSKIAGSISTLLPTTLIAEVSRTMTISFLQRRNEGQMSITDFTEQQLNHGKILLKAVKSNRLMWVCRMTDCLRFADRLTYQQAERLLEAVGATEDEVSDYQEALYRIDCNEHLQEK